MPVSSRRAGEAPPFDLLIRGGTVIDPLREDTIAADVGVRAGRIAAVAPGLRGAAAEEFDARGMYVVPGLVDFHVHVYWGATFWGIEADKAGAAGGTTTFLDAGSAGATTFPAFRRYVIDRSRTRIRALVHIGTTGLTTAISELRDPRFLDIPGAVATVEANPGVVVGVKIRYSDTLVGTGAQARAALAAAIEAAERAGTWLMVHVSRTPEPFDRVIEKLRPGDVITHAFTGRPGGPVDHKTARLTTAAVEGRERGVLFDIGHGSGSFGWDAAAAALDAGFPPDIISTDLHRACINGPTYDFPTTMTKFWLLGMELPDVVRRSTLAPAQRLGVDAGTLRIGAEADIAVLELVEEPVTLTDAYGQTREWDRRLRAAATYRAGERLDPEVLGPQTPQPDTIESWKLDMRIRARTGF